MHIITTLWCCRTWIQRCQTSFDKNLLETNWWPSMRLIVEENLVRTAQVDHVLRHIWYISTNWDLQKQIVAVCYFWPSYCTVAVWKLLKKDFQWTHPDPRFGFESTVYSPPRSGILNWSFNLNNSYNWAFVAPSESNIFKHCGCLVTRRLCFSGSNWTKQSYRG